MKFVFAVVILVLVSVSVYAGDIVTVPTANQLKMGQFDVAIYHLGLDMPDAAPQDVQAQTLYVGITNRIEFDVHRYDIDKVGDSTIINASFLVLEEGLVKPNVVIGGRNLLGERVTDPQSEKRSYFIAAAKTLNLPAAGAPTLPIIRLHAGIGTEDWTLLNEKRHEGLFGGVQALLTPKIGAIALHDGQDLITGLTFMPNKSTTLKGGMFGDHWWVGASYAHSL